MSLKHVYIVGAGFSAAIGGPLFNQLMTTELQSCRLPGDEDLPLARGVDTLFSNQLDPKQRALDERMGRRLDAEQLLELLDECSNNPESKKARRFAESMGLFHEPVEVRERLLKAAIVCVKRLIAAQVQSFLEYPDSSPDKWEPFKKWFSEASARDTIISFNYDTAIEKLCEYAGKPKPSGIGLQSSYTPWLLKLHGSVDWVKSGDRIEQREGSIPHGEEIAIGIPGMEKANIPNQPVFRTLWMSARNELRDADFVSIVGYSMPQTDNAARMMILDAIAGGREKKKRINLVLGPAAETITAKRMHALIRPLVPADCKVEILPFYAQDYLPNVRDYGDIRD